MTTVKFEIVKIIKKGLGWLCTQDIKAGETIFTERPLKLFNASRGSIKLPSIEQQVKELDDESRNIFLSLKACNNQNDMMDIWQNNCITDPEGTTAAIYPKCCRINHSCSFNSFWFFPTYEADFQKCTDALASKGQFKYPKLTLHLIALKDIKKGEEITSTYLPSEKELFAYQQRQRVLYEKFGFVCECELCEKAASTDKHVEQLVKTLTIVKNVLNENMKKFKFSELKYYWEQSTDCIHFMETKLCGFGMLHMIRLIWCQYMCAQLMSVKGNNNYSKQSQLMMAKYRMRFRYHRHQRNYIASFFKLTASNGKQVVEKCGWFELMLMFQYSNLPRK